MGSDTGVTVTGSASVETIPDIVVAALGVDVRAADISTALRTAEASLARMRDALLAGGVDRTDLRSTRSNIWREDRTEDSGATTTVIHVRLGLQATLRAVAVAGELVHAALAAAGTDASMDSLDFAVSDAGPALVRARDAAFDDARHVAAAYAARAGRALGRVISIVEGSGGEGPAPRAAYAVMEKAVRSMPVEPGQQSVTAAVTVTWELAD